MTILRHHTFGTLLLIPLLSLMQTQPVAAAMVATEQALAAQRVNTDRNTVLSFVQRADVQQRLQALGVTADTARARVAALSDAEVATLAGRIDKLPAGGYLSQTDLILILLIAILVVIAA